MQPDTPAQRVMLISCEPEIHMHAPPYLRRLGYDITAVLAPVEAERHATEHGWPDLIVVDGEFAPFIALDFCARARNEAALAIALLIAPRQEYYVKKAAKPSSVDFFVNKPIQRYDLPRYIDRGLHLLAKTDRRPALFDDLHIDFVTGELVSNGRSICLTPTENRFIYLLLNNTGTVVSQREIARALWPETTFNSDSLRTLVSRLRRKLKGTDVIIRNMRGRGYYIEGQRVVVSSTGTQDPDS